MDLLLVFFKLAGLALVVFFVFVGIYSLYVLAKISDKTIGNIMDDLEGVQPVIDEKRLVETVEAIKDKPQLPFFKLDFKDGNGDSQIWIASGETAEEAKNKVLAIAPNLASQVVMDEELDQKVATFVCDLKEHTPMIYAPRPGRSTPINRKDTDHDFLHG
jgi:hypothetical protein